MRESPIGVGDDSHDDPDLIADSLVLLSAFRDIRDAKVRRTVIFLARALRPDPGEAAIVAKVVPGADRRKPQGPRG